MSTEGAAQPYSLHLICLQPSYISKAFVSRLNSLDVQYLVAGVPYYFVVPPNNIDKRHLLQTSWDVVVLLPWTAHTSLDASAVAAAKKDNSSLLHPSPNSIPRLSAEWTTGSLPPSAISSAKSHDSNAIGRVDITPTLSSQITDYGAEYGSTPVTMLNLLAMAPDGGMEKYQGYVGGFVEAFGGDRLGSVAKVLGPVEATSTNAEESHKSTWDMWALVHYPSIWHFGWMLSTPGYQELEEKYKAGSLVDTAILAVSEIAVV